MKFNSLALSLAVLLSGGSSCEGFMSPKHQSSSGIHWSIQTKQKQSSTELYIIGPMLRKMREEQAKKKMPMASEDERRDEAPGLRVGTNAWKWPPVWPYSVNDFTPKDDIAEPPQANPMAGIMGMNGAMPPPVPEVEEKEKLDVLNYWGEEKAMERTDIDDGAVAALKNHYSFYLKDGMKVLELGAAENSYLPDDLKLEKLVGVGANMKLMEENPALTESMVVDLNNVIAEQGVDSDELKALGAGTFDVIIMANTIDFLTQPREVFRSAWALLKPGGLMIVPFTNREAYTNKFGRAQTKMWKDMNDDQHMWICGSFFQFSASDGWEGLKGFDISPEDAKKDEGILGALKNNNKNNMFVVQATKAYVDEFIDPEDPEKSFKSKMWLLPTLEERDKQLLGSRLARVYKTQNSDEETEALIRNVETLPKVYESLIKMDQFAFTFGMQAQLAADLIADPDFNGNDEQILAMKMGLGLRTPSEFWELIGQRTFSMNPDEKVNLLAHIVPRFGSDDPEQEEAMQAFVAGLEPTFAVVRSKCPSMSDADVQLIGTELLASEILQPGRSTKKEFATWVSSLTKEELEEVLTKRKAFKEKAMADMKVMQEERKAREEEIEAQRQKMIEQQKKAREERSLAFNPETGKMEIMEKKEEKK